MTKQSLAVVIGAGGMGAAIAATLSRDHAVLLADIDAARAEQRAAALRSEGRTATAACCDVTSAESVYALAAMVGERGGFRVLAHVAGMSPSMAAFDAIMRVNLLGPARVAQALLPFAQPGAAAIVIASLGAHLVAVPPPVAAVLREHATQDDISERLRAELGEDAATSDRAYQLSKFGVLMLCRREAARWAERQARILSVSPGLIATPMGAREWETNPAKRRLAAMVPLKREGRLDEISEVVAFLASDRASFITGTDVLIDGGLAGAISDVPFGGGSI